MRPASCPSVKCKPSNLPQACNFIKKRLWHRCSPVNFAKILRTPFLQNSSGRLLVEAHSKLSQTSKMEVFTKIVNSCLLFSQKSSISNIRLGSEYASGVNNQSFIWESYQSELYPVCIISLHHFEFAPKTE